MENTPLESRMWFRMNFTSGVFSSKTLVSIIYNNAPVIKTFFPFFLQILKCVCLTLDWQTFGL